MRGNSLTIRWARAFLKVFSRSGPNFLRMKSGLLLLQRKEFHVGPARHPCFLM